ncbi:MAG: hypothetical protein IT453_01285 [Planctomycetes bacterium]|nr:hypothetical protein [Planctomycetota bacterium]
MVKRTPVSSSKGKKLSAVQTKQGKLGSLPSVAKAPAVDLRKASKTDKVVTKAVAKTPAKKSAAAPPKKGAKKV